MEYFSITDKGNVRKNNEDYYKNMKINDHTILVLCDGMGGHLGGEIASKTAAEAFIQSYETHSNKNLSELDLLYGALYEASQSVYLKSKEEKCANNMGTTIVATVIFNDTCYNINVGDSRAYIKNEFGFRQISTDHTYLQELMEKGMISEEQAKSSDKKNILTRGLGFEEMDHPDSNVLELSPGDFVLMCSDGLSSFVKDSEIDQVLSSDASLEEKCDILRNIALENKSNDNITITLYKH